MLLRAQEKFVKNTENMLKNMLPSRTNTTGVNFLVVPSPMNAGHKQARVAEPVSATRGSQSALHCGLPGFEPSLSKNRRVASSPHTRVGCEDIRARVLLAICNHPSQIFQSDFLSCKRQIIQKKINIYVMRNISGAEPMQLLRKEFSCSQEGWRTASDWT